MKLRSILFEHFVGTYRDIDLFINPNNLSMFDSYARGVILKNGDFYMAKKTAAYRGAIIHEGILDLLYYELNLISDYYHWPLRIPTEFLCVQRDGESYKFYAAESYHSGILDFDSTDKIIKAAESKNPNYTFTLDRRY